MLLAIDVGNTETVVGVFQGQELMWHWRSSTVAERTADELALLLGGFLEQQGLSFSRQITGVALASVVPDQTLALREMVRNYFHFAPVVVEPGTVRVAVELEHDQVAAVRELGHPRVQLAVAPKTKSVTAAHRPDLVPLLEAVEDLAAAAAETTREPVAAEAVIAWEVAE